jgi:hypothetical protein
MVAPRQAFVNNVTEKELSVTVISDRAVLARARGRWRNLLRLKDI